jgi:hypothetical protein
MTASLVPVQRVADAGAQIDPAAASAPDDPAAASAPDDPAAAQEQALAVRRAQFDFDLEQRAELQREADALRDMMLAELKAEDGYLKKWIEMI